MATTQRERNAAQARKKMEARRDDADGAAGWVAQRAGEWTLEGTDDRFMDRQKYLWNPLMDYWFRMEIEGWEHLPEPPVLLVGIHSGAPFVWDAWTVGIQWWRRFGDRPPAARHRPRRADGGAAGRQLLPPHGRAPGGARLDRVRARRGPRRGAVAGR